MKVTDKQFTKDYKILEAVCKELSVELKREAKSYFYYPDSKVIALPKCVKSKASLIVGLLHEIGHVIHRDSIFGGLSKTENHNRVIIVEGEYKAWEHGYYLLQKLNLEHYNNFYIKEWAKSWNLYIKHVKDCHKLELLNMRVSIID